MKAIIPRTHRLITMAAGLALMMSGAGAGAAEAEDAGRKRDIFYKGDPAICLKLLRESSRIRFLEPVLGPTRVSDLLIGHDPDPRVRIYFSDPELSNAEIDRRRGLGGWKTIVETVPPDADRVPARMVYDARWARYGKDCPDLFVFRQGSTGEVFDVPVEMALYKFDIDGDGFDETILWREATVVGEGYYVVDFKTCKEQLLLGTRRTTEVFAFDGKLHVGSIGHHPSAWTVDYLVDSKFDEIDPNNVTCIFKGFPRLGEYVRDPSQFHKPKPEE